MASKKGEGVRGMLGVRGVMGDLVTTEKERNEPASRPEPHIEPTPPKGRIEPQRYAEEEQGSESPELRRMSDTPHKKATGIKGRPRVKRDDSPAPKAEKKTKVTLSIEEDLREQFYRLAHGEMMQPGEFVERALRYYIKHTAKRP